MDGFGRSGRERVKQHFPVTKADKGQKHFLPYPGVMGGAGVLRARSAIGLECFGKHLAELATVMADLGRSCNCQIIAALVKRV